MAIELLHNAFLVHDDIEDASLLRRGEPTLHRRYGTPLALNAGDGLALQAMATLRENIDRLGPRLADRIMVEFDFMSQQTVAGQALELGWCRDNRIDLTPDDYLELINPLWSTQELRGRIERVEPETGDAVTIHITPGWEWEGHAPGQYLRVGVQVDGVHHWRAYSLTSDPGRADGQTSTWWLPSPGSGGPPAIASRCSWSYVLPVVARQTAFIHNDSEAHPCRSGISKGSDGSPSSPATGIRPPLAPQ